MNKVVRMLALTLVVIGMLGSMLSPTIATEPQQSNNQVAQGDSGLRSFNGQTGALNFINFAGQRSDRASNTNETMSIANKYAGQFGLAAGSQLSLIGTRQSSSGSIYYHFQQTYNGIPIIAGELKVAADSRGMVTALSGEFAQDLSAVMTTPGFSTSDAARNAVAFAANQSGLSASAFSATPARVSIYDPSLLSPFVDPPSLVYQFDVRAPGYPYNYFVLVGAHRGNIELAFNQIDTLLSDEDAERYAREVAESEGSEGVARIDPGTPTIGTLLPNFNATATTYNSNNTSDRQGAGSSTLICTDTQPGDVVTLTGADSCEGSGNATRVNSAHFFALQTHDYYDGLFGRNSIDNAGMDLISNVDFRPSGSPYFNAFWDGEQMTYGDGDFFTADDIVGHELTHGVTDNTSNLYYYYESGAINEAISDIFGEMIDQLNGIQVNGATGTVSADSPGSRWLMGEDLGIGAIRHMSNPPAFGDPDRTRSPNYIVTDIDSGGVHSNSGVANKAVSLMVDGGSFNGQSITALAPATADAYKLVGHIFYEVEYLLSSGSDFGVLNQALSTACNTLAGKPLSGTAEVLSASDCTEVHQAALATQMHLEPGYAGFSPEVPVACNTPGTSPTLLYFNDMESGTGDFILNSPVWSLNSSSFFWTNNSRSGDNNLYADDFYTGSNHSAAMNFNVSLTGATEYGLHVWHAWDLQGFSGTMNDGFVLEYSTNNGSTWTDAGSLFSAGQNYNGTISSGSNPLNGRQAFGFDSHGYVTSRYNLSSLNGQNVRFRWRLGTNNSSYDWGVWVDDITIYACMPSQPLTASVTCNHPNMEVTITAGDGPFNITATEGDNMPVIGVSIGTTVVLGPERWRDVTVTETTGDSESLLLDDKIVCRSTEDTILYWPPHRYHTTNTSTFFDWSDTTDANLYRIFIFDNKVQADRTIDIRQNNSISQWTASPPLPTMRLFWRARARVNSAWGFWSVRHTLFVDPPSLFIADDPAPSEIDPTPIGPVVVPTNVDSSEQVTPVAPTDVPTEVPTELPPPPNSR